MILSKELLVFLIAMSPLVELRGAIPIAITVYHFTWFKAFIISVIGNSLIILPVMFFLEYLSDWLMEHFNFFNRFFNWLFAKTRQKINKSYITYRNLALLVFVAIPLPTTGAWTGTVAAYLLGISKKEAFIYITGGVIIAGIIITIMTLIGKQIF